MSDDTFIMIDYLNICEDIDQIFVFYKWLLKHQDEFDGKTYSNLSNLAGDKLDQIMERSKNVQN